MTKIALSVSFLILGCSVLVAQTAPDIVKGATQDKVYHVGGDVKAPRAISSAEPTLGDSNENIKGRGKTVDAGSATLSIVVDKDGSVRKVKVLRGLKPDLDAKAVASVKQWKFDPATKKGIPVAVEIDVQVDFHLYQ